jgi:hypothetical protein
MIFTFPAIYTIFNQFPESVNTWFRGLLAQVKTFFYINICSQFVIQEIRSQVLAAV